MKWVTRRTIRVNRAATAWLIRRFIDRDATFAFVDPEQVAEVERREGARSFDAPAATYPHKDAQGRCSFEALVAEHCPDDPVLRMLARIVRGADFGDEVTLTPESTGLRVISRGFPLVARDDHETVEKVMFLYDALYASLAERHADEGA
ncbi:MAG: chromate resistance protein [Deltaproteobacteria bacterium]|nr:chromate resistance protein [Deltaproteobacteria bacterium]